MLEVWVTPYTKVSECLGVDYRHHLKEPSGSSVQPRPTATTVGSSCTAVGAPSLVLHPVQCEHALTDTLALLPWDISHQQWYESICPWVRFVIPRVVRNRSLCNIQSPKHVSAYLKLKLKWWVSHLRHQPLKTLILFFSSTSLWPMHLFLIQEWTETSLFLTWILNQMKETEKLWINIRKLALSASFTY